MIALKYDEEEIRSDKKIFESLSNKTILVCGATGLIGSSVIDCLMAANKLLGLSIRIIALARNPIKLKERFKGYLDDVNFSYLVKDVTEFSPNDIFEENLNYIIQAASPAHPVAYSKYPVDVIRSNVFGTYTILNAIRKTDCRLLYVSSSEVYGQTYSVNNEVNEKPNQENDYGYIDILLQRACYPEAKRATESLCIAFSAQYGTDVVIARPCQVYGPSITKENSRADAQFLRNCVNGENIVMKSAGTQIRSMCYVKDAVNAILYILLYGTKGNAYNIANKESIASIFDFASCMAKEAGVKIVYNEAQKVEATGFSIISRAVIDARKLEELGWRPKYSIEQGVKETIALAKCKK